MKSSSKESCQPSFGFPIPDFRPYNIHLFQDDKFRLDRV